MAGADRQQPGQAGYEMSAMWNLKDKIKSWSNEI